MEKVLLVGAKLTSVNSMSREIVSMCQEKLSLVFGRGITDGAKIKYLTSQKVNLIVIH